MGESSMLWDRWATPAGLLLLLGGITWGVQLNVGFIRLTESLTNTQSEMIEHRRLIAEASRNNMQTTLLLAELRRDLDRLEKRDSSHNSEAEEWKRRIAILEELTRNKE